METIIRFTMEMLKHCKILCALCILWVLLFLFGLVWWLFKIYFHRAWSLLLLFLFVNKFSWIYTIAIVVPNKFRLSLEQYAICDQNVNMHHSLSICNGELPGKELKIRFEYLNWPKRTVEWSQSSSLQQFPRK